MRLFEILIPVSLIIHLNRPFFTRRNHPAWPNGLLVLTVVFLTTHLTIEGYRWQMIPLYALAAVLILMRLVEISFMRERTRVDRRLAIIGSIVGQFMVVLAAALPLVLPVPQPLEPSGPFPVGTVTFEFVDHARTELYSSNPTEPRRLMVQVWYPGEEREKAPKADWIRNADIVAPAVASWLDLPEYFLDHLALAKTSAMEGIPLASGQRPFPVLLFSHGWGGMRAQNTFQAQELASNGFIVVGVEHTYGAVVTVFPDGFVAYNNPDTLPSGLSDDDYATAARKLGRQWAEDLTFIVDRLAKMNNDTAGDFKGTLDLSRLGVFGHSTGGGASIEFCANDPRCKAGLAMDPYMPPVSLQTLENGIEADFLFMFSEVWSSEKNTALFNRFYSNLSNPLDILTIIGTRHYDFSDLPMLSPMAPQLELKGPLKGSRVLSIINHYSLAFFNGKLKGQDSVLLLQPSDEFPEVIFTDTLTRKVR